MEITRAGQIVQGPSGAAYLVVEILADGAVKAVRYPPRPDAVDADQVAMFAKEAVEKFVPWAG